MKWFWVNFLVLGWRLVTGKTKPWLEAWNFHSLLNPLSVLWRGEKGWRWICWSIIPTWWSLYKPQNMGLGSFQVDKHSRTGRVTHPSLGNTPQAPAFRTLPDLILCIFWSDCWFVAFNVSFNILVNISVPLSSVSCSSMRTSDL